MRSVSDEVNCPANMFIGGECDAAYKIRCCKIISLLEYTIKSWYRKMLLDD